MGSKIRWIIGLMTIAAAILGSALLLTRGNEPVLLLTATPEATVGLVNSESLSLASTQEVSAENPEFTYCSSPSGETAVDQALSFIKSEAQFLSRSNDSSLPIYRY